MTVKYDVIQLYYLTSIINKPLMPGRVRDPQKTGIHPGHTNPSPTRGYIAERRFGRSHEKERGLSQQRGRQMCPPKLAGHTRL